MTKDVVDAVADVLTDNFLCETDPYRVAREIIAIVRAAKPHSTVAIQSPSALCPLLGCKVREAHEHEVIE